MGRVARTSDAILLPSIALLAGENFYELLLGWLLTHAPTIRRCLLERGRMLRIGQASNGGVKRYDGLRIRNAAGTTEISIGVVPRGSPSAQTS